jgi:3'-5' exoribonuclease
MKTAYVTDLLSEQSITSFFLVHEKELRNTREGRAYLRLELGDRSGTIEARMWDQFENVAKDINRDDFVKVQARVELYRNRPQLAVQQVRLAKPEEIDLADYLPHTTADVEKMFTELRGYAESISNPWLKQLTLSMIADPEIARCYKRAPAAILHDVGKLEELCYERAIGYTTPGQLLGHIVMELETVTRAIDKIPGFPAPLKTVVQHLLISHHGQYEFGSPKLPMIREAMVFHYLDDLDSKLAAVRVALGTASGDEEWSAYSPALGRKFLRLDSFLKDAIVPAAAPESQQSAEPKPQAEQPAAAAAAASAPEPGPERKPESLLRKLFS